MQHINGKHWTKKKVSLIKKWIETVNRPQKIEVAESKKK